MSDFLYGFVDANDRVIEFFVVQENDTETLERLKQESNSSAYHKVNDISKEISGAKEAQYWNGERFVWDSECPSWIFDDALNSWIPPIPYPNDGKGYIWDETSISWSLNSTSD